jgi:hypothetical protein
MRKQTLNFLKGFTSIGGTKKRKLKNLQYPTPRVLAHSNVPYILGQIYHNQTFKNITKR